MSHSDYVSYLPSPYVVLPLTQYLAFTPIDGAFLRFQETFLTTLVSMRLLRCRLRSHEKFGLYNFDLWSYTLLSTSYVPRP